jgi:hypothetical protein
MVHSAALSKASTAQMVFDVLDSRDTDTLS